MQIGNATAHVLTTGRSDRVSRNEVKTRKRPMAVPRIADASRLDSLSRRNSYFVYSTLCTPRTRENLKL